MKKKFGDFTFNEVAEECKKHETCKDCPFEEVCSKINFYAHTPPFLKGAGLFSKDIEINE